MLLWMTLALAQPLPPATSDGRRLPDPALTGLDLRGADAAYLATHALAFRRANSWGYRAPVLAGAGLGLTLVGVGLLFNGSIDGGVLPIMGGVVCLGIAPFGGWIGTLRAAAILRQGGVEISRVPSVVAGIAAFSMLLVVTLPVAYPVATFLPMVQASMNARAFQRVVGRRTHTVQITPFQRGDVRGLALSGSW